jgi:hypothetical protein
MTTSSVHPAAAKRDAAHRRVRRVTLGVAAAVVGATSYGAVALAQSTADNGSITSVSHQGSTGSNVSSGTGQTPVASSGGS